jgi:hypothetical protein
VKGCIAEIVVSRRARFVRTLAGLTDTGTPQDKARRDLLGNGLGVTVFRVLDGDNHLVRSDLLYSDEHVSYKCTSQSTAEMVVATVWTGTDLVLVHTVTSFLANFFSAYSEIFSE